MNLNLILKMYNAHKFEFDKPCIFTPRHKTSSTLSNINNIPPTSTKFVSYSSNQGWRRTTREKTEPQTHPTPLWMNPYPRGPRGTLVPRG